MNPAFYWASSYLANAVGIATSIYYFISSFFVGLNIQRKNIMNVHTGRGLVNDTYKMDLILVHPPHLIALACIYIAIVLRDKDTTAWFEELRVDMNVVSVPLYF